PIRRKSAGDKIQTVRPAKTGTRSSAVSAPAAPERPWRAAAMRPCSSFVLAIRMQVCYKAHNPDWQEKGERRWPRFGAPSVIGVGGVAQPVAKKVERENGQDDRHDRQHQPGIERDDTDILRLVEEDAPAGDRGPQAES